MKNIISSIRYVFLIPVNIIPSHILVAAKDLINTFQAYAPVTAIINSPYHNFNDKIAACKDYVNKICICRIELTDNIYNEIKSQSESSKIGIIFTMIAFIIDLCSTCISIFYNSGSKVINFIYDISAYIHTKSSDKVESNCESILCDKVYGIYDKYEKIKFSIKHSPQIIVNACSFRLNQTAEDINQKNLKFLILNPFNLMKIISANLAHIYDDLKNAYFHSYLNHHFPIDATTSIPLDPSFKPFEYTNNPTNSSLKNENRKLIPVNGAIKYPIYSGANISNINTVFRFIDDYKNEYMVYFKRPLNVMTDSIILTIKSSEECISFLLKNPSLCMKNFINTVNGYFHQQNIKELPTPEEDMINLAGTMLNED